MSDRHRPGALLLLVLIALSLVGARQGGRAQVVGRWIGQDGHDLVGGNPGPSKNDYQDIRIAVKGLPSNRTIAQVVIHGHGGGEWKLSNKDQFTVLVDRKPRSTSADLYIEPYQVEAGREFEITLKLDDGREVAFNIPGGRADNNLRAAGAGVEVKWLGQDGIDRTNPGASVGPDGVEDIHLALARLTAKAEIRDIEIQGPKPLAWCSGLNPQGLPAAEFARDKQDPSRGDLYFSPIREMAGQPLKLTVHYADGRTDAGAVAAGKASPAKILPRVTTPTLRPSQAAARWLGQDGVSPTPGDVHLTLEGISPSRAIASAVLTDGVCGTWAFRASDQSPSDAGPFADRLNLRKGADNRLELAFPPVRDETKAGMTLRLVDPSGHQEVLSFPGGPCDPNKRHAPLPPGSVVARVGDDLQGLADRHGTVTLSPGNYPMARPLVLHRPTRLVGQAGAVLTFKQAADQPPWTASIKIHAGGTTLEGFAVRFAGPVRWDNEVSFGPAVIGTTDDRDKAPADSRHDIRLTHLDLEGPPASSPNAWEVAPNLIRLVTAGGGRVERNVLKGGTVAFHGGPWTIVDNDYRGTLPGTFSYSAFSARYTHDLLLARNHARGTVGPSGKTWRFLVLTQRGANDRINDNVIEGGIGPREDDPHPHENSPEVILTESYRLHFEGKPAAISADGRVVTIPHPQGGGASTGDALAVLDGPDAGRWRTIAQPIGADSYLLDAPIDRSTGAVSIATAFVNETFEGNTVDCRGTALPANLVLAGNLFGVKVLNNRFLGGGETIRLLAAPTEEPVHWGWSHTLFLGGTFAGNTIEDSLGTCGIGVEHGVGIKANKGRAYMTLSLLDNTFRWTDASRDRRARSAATGKPVRLALGFAPSLDPGELIITEKNTRLEGNFDPAEAWIPAATVNGQVVREAPLKPSKP